ncbi:hypothetical protein KSZ_16130 [Dictyobacter formicarum]|uniref:ABC transmembrane type-1 domain-containing protein n=1 Tax=Dictyobacter formicarum TaxID=2778368 RepID=A0ABQ3VBS2_9CHLR|nr:hypothetical protein KSZ_16130 [Dictyobacter formicarum]
MMSLIAFVNYVGYFTNSTNSTNSVIEKVAAFEYIGTEMRMNNEFATPQRVSM